MPFTSRKSWRSKLEKQQEPKLIEIPPELEKRYGVGKMLIPRPLDVDAVIRQVKKGRLITQSQIRKHLALAAGAASSCPIATGIFIRISAEAANEDFQAGKTRITPYWRVIRDDGSLLEKNPGGVAGQTERLAAEGHQVVPSKGKKPPKVENFERKLTQLAPPQASAAPAS